MQEPLLVTIRCLTFNHEPYIRQCLESFVMQKTNFRFEAIVHDDASTDGTADIIREYAEKYPDIIKPILETENQYSKHDGSLVRILNEHTHGKYVAYCEGDDFWTDPKKLQKQVDFLEANPDYGLIHTNIQIYNQNKGTISPHMEKHPIDGNGTINLLLGKGHIATLSVCYRSELLNKIDKSYLDQDFSMGDYPLWIEISRHCKIKFFPEVTATYRVLDNSISHPVDYGKHLLFYKNAREIRCYFVKKYNIRSIYRQTFRSYYFYDSLYQLYCGNCKPFWKAYFKAMPKSLINIWRYVNVIKHRFSK